jgi:4-hydroxymandelate oxidase
VRLDPGTYDYYASGSDDETTMRANRAAFERLALRPRWMVDVSTRDLSTTVLSQRWPMPVAVAPTALAGMAHPDGETGISRAAGRSGIPTTISTFSTTSIEAVARAATGPLWFQLYIYRNRDITQRLVERAEQAGYQALVLTVDVPVTSNRERDKRSQFRIPSNIVLANFTEFALDHVPDAAGQSSIIANAQAQLDPAVTWEAIDWLRTITRLPIWVKGNLRGDDATLAVEHGAAGVIVSNHGGRQLDTSPATIDVLPEIVCAVVVHCDILLDGGVRRGTDIV